MAKAPRRLGLAVLATLVLGLSIVGAYLYGQRKGFETGTAWAFSEMGLATGAQGAAILTELEKGNTTEATRLLDLLVDSGISQFSMRRERPGKMGGPPSAVQESLYDYLLEYRRSHPSSIAGETTHIGPRVAKALLETSDTSRP